MRLLRRFGLCVGDERACVGSGRSALRLGWGKGNRAGNHIGDLRRGLQPEKWARSSVPILAGMEPYWKSSPGPDKPTPGLFQSRSKEFLFSEIYCGFLFRLMKAKVTDSR
jgi:hypothetical protein